MGQDILCGAGMGTISCPHAALYFGVRFIGYQEIK